MEEWYIKAFASIKASFRGAGLYFLYQLNFYLVFPPATICHHLSPYENSHQGEHSSWRMCLLCQKVMKHFSVDGNCSLIFFFRSCVWTRIINTCNRYKYRGAGETPWVQDKFQKCLNISYSKYLRASFNLGLFLPAQGWFHWGRGKNQKTKIASLKSVLCKQWQKAITGGNDCSSAVVDLKCFTFELSYYIKCNVCTSDANSCHLCVPPSASERVSSPWVLKHHSGCWR